MRNSRVVDVGAQVLARHHVVGAAVCLTCDDGELGHGGLGVRVQQLGAVTDDAAVPAYDVQDQTDSRANERVKRDEPRGGRQKQELWQKRVFEVHG